MKLTKSSTKSKPEILQYFDTVHRNGACVEIRRIIDGRSTGCAILDNAEAAVMLERMDRESPGGYYLIPNSSDDTLFKRTWGQEFVGAPLTTKENILSRDFIYIDVDRIKKLKDANPCASDAENKESKKLALEIIEYLKQRGYGEPLLFIFTGNGYHIYYRIALPTGSDLVKRFLYGLSKKFEGRDSEIDTGVHDAPRLMGIPGTLNTKGSAPFRRRKILVRNPDAEIISPELLDTIAEQPPALTPPQPTKKSTGRFKHVENTLESCKAYALFFGYEILREESNPDGSWKLFINRCHCGVPSANKNEIVLMGGPLYKRPKFNNFRNRCESKGCCNWDLFREACEPGWLKYYFQVPPVNINPRSWGERTSVEDAKRMAQMFPEKAKYCAKFKEWFLYDGILWAVDELGMIRQYALKTRGWLYAEAKIAENETEKESNEEARKENAKRLRKWAVELGKGRRAKELLEWAQTTQGMYITPDELDANGSLLNCDNLTLDLATGETHDHDPNDHCTKAAVAYNPAAKSKVWDKFINDITGVTAARTPAEVKSATEFRDYLKRCVGMSLDEASAKVHWIGFILGQSGTGKGTFIAVLLSAFRTFAHTVGFETFAKKSGDVDIQAQLKLIRGYRTIFVDEIGDYRKIDVALANKVSGGTEISPRSPYEIKPESWVFKGKLWFFANNPFNVPPAEDGMWRRLKVLRFSYKPEKEDQELLGTLLQPDNLAAVLAWAVEGHKDWKENGLQEPQCVIDWTNDFRGSTNPVEDFLENFCETDPTCITHILNADIFDLFQHWIDDEKRKTAIKDVRGLWNVISKHKNYGQLEPYRDRSQRGYTGIRFKQKEVAEFEEMRLKKWQKQQEKELGSSKF